MEDEKVSRSRVIWVRRLKCHFGRPNDGEVVNFRNVIRNGRIDRDRWQDRPSVTFGVIRAEEIEKTNSSSDSIDVGSDVESRIEDKNRIK